MLQVRLDKVTEKDVDEMHRTLTPDCKALYIRGAADYYGYSVSTVWHIVRCWDRSPNAPWRKFVR